MKNIDKVLQAVNTLNEQTDGVTTQSLSTYLSMDRTLVSRLLNELVEEQRILKQGKRPVFYVPISTEELGEKQEVEAESVLDKMIGADGSLRFGIEQCKSAVKYPKCGLTMLITGHSGVGKSYLASLVHQYAVDENILDGEAVFIVFNCADYASNAELLSSKLFGYKKGAFTGADGDQDGIIAQADGGYLFLDEVHRLSPEGQEKLFLLLDKGIYQQLGDKNYRKADVRLICATTESPKEVLIDTFLRRIPIIVNLPDLLQRDVRERLAFIQYFYTRESLTFHKRIMISKKVINYLLTCSFAGNIGELKNIIKVSCANASRKEQNDVVYVDVNDLAIQRLPSNDVMEYFQEDMLEVGNQVLVDTDVSIFQDGKVQEIIDLIGEVYKQLKILSKKDVNEEETLKLIRMNIHRISDILYFKNRNFNHDLYTNLFATHVEKGLKLLEKTYGVRYYGNTVKTLSEALLSLHDPKFDQESYHLLYQKTLDMLKVHNYKYDIMAKCLIEYLSDSFGYTCGVLEELYVSLYALTMASNHSNNDINIVILAHGYSTASSIASVVNQMHSNYIIEAFDMPIDMEPMDIVEEIKKYAKHLNKDKGTIFLVDMGSLFDIYSLVKDCFDGEVVVINNISTHLALAVGSMVNQGSGIIDIIDHVVKESEIKYKYYERKGKKKAIVTTCATGIGTAHKIRDMIKKCIIRDEHALEVVSCDYFSLKNMGLNSEIFNKYDVQLIITTLGLKIPNVPTMLFSELFSRENEDKVREVFKRLYDEESVEQVINNLMKMLTLENVISRLIILNPSRVIDNVGAIIQNIEERFQVHLDSNLKLSLYIHIAIMIERCVLMHDKDEELPRVPSNIKERKRLRNIFDDCLTDFDVDIPDQELDIILRLMNEYHQGEIDAIGEDE